MVNRMLQLPTRVINAFASINEGNTLKGAANVAAITPLPYFALVAAGIRSGEGFLNNNEYDFKYWSPYESGRKVKRSPKKKFVRNMKPSAPTPQRQPQAAPTSKGTGLTGMLNGLAQEYLKLEDGVKKSLDRRLLKPK